jgi:hypothetical protein
MRRVNSVLMLLPVELEPTSMVGASAVTTTSSAAAPSAKSTAFTRMVALAGRLTPSRVYGRNCSFSKVIE